MRACGLWSGGFEPSGLGWDWNLAFCSQTRMPSAPRRAHATSTDWNKATRAKYARREYKTLFVDDRRDAF